MPSVASIQEQKSGFREKEDFSRLPIRQGEGEFFPSAQTMAFAEQIEHVAFTWT